MKARRDLTLFLVVLVLCVGALTPAQARQIGARKAPAVTGPLTGGEPSCEKAEAIDEGSEEVVAMVKLCVRLYALDPASENDEANNYGILWLQSTVDARNDWCATEVTTSGLISSGGTVYDKAPGKKMSTERARTVNIGLRADAQGHATETARLDQELVLLPRRYATTLSATDEGTLARGRWVGSAGRKLAFALGVELSWPAGIGSPEMQPELTYSFEKKDRC